ncbi:MAG TPA: histidine--tRNA ligase [Acidimicrobiales bacterium]|nr:histidine--tRNA ligase [Acidimicrobiales bacterium]
MSGFQAPKGTHDVLPPESARFASCVASFAGIVERAGYGLVVSPMFEDAAVFRRGAGESSDVARKEMYEFEDKGGDLLALRPEGTASVVRAYVQHRPLLPFKTWYVTPQFRYEQPQAGRYRQHHQLGVEVLGIEDPDVDVEVIALLVGYLSSLGLAQLELAVNSMGDRNCRPAYLESLTHFLATHESELCDEHRPGEGRPGWQLNPLRFFDCKRPECLALRPLAPRLGDWLCDACKAHHARVTEGLDALGIGWHQDDALVRGFDYYTRTTFEVASPALGTAQNALGGGGRYDGLVETLGGPPTPGVGFGSGIERVLLACDAEAVLPPPQRSVEVFVVDLVGGDAARLLTHELRAAGVPADRAFGGRSMKAQLKLADRSGALVALIVGPEERAAGVVTVRPLRAVAGEDGQRDRQQQVPRQLVVEHTRVLVGQLRAAA